MLQLPDLQTAEQLRRRLSPAQLAWLGGYFSAAAGDVAASAATIAALSPVVAAGNAEDNNQNTAILYGSQTGNGKKIAESLAALLSQRGLRAAAVSMENYKTARLKKEKQLFAVVSTHGEGEPPDAAADFLAFLQSARAPRLPGLRFAVLALGDSSYEHFCQTGRDLHNCLQKLGAQPMFDIAECDADYETAAGKWREQIADAAAVNGDNGGGAINGANGVNNINGIDKNQMINGAAINTPLQTPATTAAGTIDINAPFAAEVLANIKLSGEGRNVRHLELSIANASTQPQPGDSIGIAPQNDETLALLVCEKLGMQPDDKTDIDGEVATAGEWLRQKLDITRPTLPVLRRYAEVVNNNKLNGIYEDREKAISYLRGRDILQLLTDFPPPPGCGIAVMKTLRRLTPRLYSLASAREGEAHLLIADAAYYDNRGRLRRGVCSDYLSALAPGAEVRAFVQDNELFRPPDANTPLIMIGAGAGVAPFRAFMEEREEREQSGDTWLFFGERRRRDDFYYQREWLRRLPPSQGGLANGGGAPLTKLSAAFSRDGGGKVYVQHKLYQNADQLRRWIQDGASIYVCGDEKGMGRDVHKALADIAGAETLATMQREKRYRRDVY